MLVSCSGLAVQAIDTEVKDRLVRVAGRFFARRVGFEWLLTQWGQSMSTASVGNILLDKEILLESGTNELEVLVFDVANFTFGINVAKVREVLPATQITCLPKAHASVRGVFKLRNQVVPCVSLIDHLKVSKTRVDSEETIILSDFNNQQTAFLVDQVERIHRLSWENILAVPPLMSLAQTPVTAVARIENRLVVMLDFEMIIDQVTDQFFRTEGLDNPLGLPRHKLRILLADDSPTIRQAVTETLTASGYTHLHVFENGKEVWNWIEQRLEETGRAEDVADLLISDVEMPLIDGFHLTKLIKEHPQLNKLPVLLYSSIVTPDNFKKGAAVGADSQISKPELPKVVELADSLISKARAANGHAPTADERPAAVSAEQPSPPEPTPAKSDSSPPPADKAPAQTEPPAAKAQPAPTVAVPNTALWQTFREELANHVAFLAPVVQSLAHADDRAEGINQIFRTLHTIKGASMLVPVEEVTRTTHLIESLLEPARTDATWWPQEGLDRYLKWLEALLGPESEAGRVLAVAGELEATLTAELADAGS